VQFYTNYEMSHCEYSYYVTLLPRNQFYRGHRGQTSHRGRAPPPTGHPLEPPLSARAFNTNQ